MVKQRISKATKSAKKTLTKRVDTNIPLPKNKFGKWLGRDIKWVPKYFRDSYAELRRVVWPDRKETWRLFVAVTVFSLFMALIIVIADNIFEQIVERLFL